MKNFIKLSILSFAIFCSGNAYSQDIDTEGNVNMTKDLSVGGGNIEFWNDVTSPTGTRVDLTTTSNGDFEIRTLGTPGARMTLQRNGGLLLENDDNNHTIQFDVTDLGSFNVNKGAGGTTQYSVNANGTMAVGTTSFDSQARLVVSQGANNQRGLLLEHSGGEFWTVDVDAPGDYNWRHRNEVNLFGGAYFDASDSYMLKNFSDRRLKSQIEHIDPVLEKVLDLEAKKYFMTGKENVSKNKSLGFIAQEVEALFPEIVSEKDGYKALSYSSFGILAIKAIQEQQQLIEKLEKRIELLENR